MSDMQVIGYSWGPAGALKPFTAGISGQQRVSDAHGRYMQAVLEGRAFVSNNQAAQAVSVALATTYTGLCLSNPAGNTKDLVLLGASFALTAAPAAIASLHLISGFAAGGVTAHTAAAIARSCNLSDARNASGLVDSQCTLVGTPYYLWPLVSGFTAAALPSMTPGFIDLGGVFVIPPGGYVAIGALTAVSGFGGLLWEEVPNGLRQG